MNQARKLHLHNYFSGFSSRGRFSLVARFVCTELFLVEKSDCRNLASEARSSREVRKYFGGLILERTRQFFMGFLPIGVVQ